MNKHNTDHNSKMSSYKNLALCSIACLIVFSFGGIFRPGEWYTQINIAPWNPPNFVFPIVWSFLYVCIAIAGWKIFNLNKTNLKILWLAQLSLNGLWSWIFFGQKWVLIGLIDIVLIIALTAILIIKCWSKSKVSAALLMPYLAWLLLASTLNLYIFLAN